MIKDMYVCTGVSLTLKCSEKHCKLNGVPVQPMFCPYSGNKCEWKKEPNKNKKESVLWTGVGAE